MYVCMYVMYVCMCVCKLCMYVMYVCMYVCMCIWMCTTSYKVYISQFSEVKRGESRIQEKAVYKLQSVYLTIHSRSHNTKCMYVMY